MIKAGTICFIAAILWIIALVGGSIYASYEYNNQIGSYWDLSVKASTLDVKSQYLDQFVQAIQNADLSGNDALIFKTPNNSYAQNFATLQSLQSRFHQVQAMDPSSFQYSQSIQQITAQEQGEAGDMLTVLHDIWNKKNYPLLWSTYLWMECVAIFLVVATAWILITIGVARKRRG